MEYTNNDENNFQIKNYKDSLEGDEMISNNEILECEDDNLKTLIYDNEDDDSCCSDENFQKCDVTDDEGGFDERSQNSKEEKTSPSSLSPNNNIIDQLQRLELNFKTPDKLLHRSRRKAKFFASKGQIDRSLTEYIRCTALARIVYGTNHWRLGSAHALLAEAYLELKGYYLQAIEHAEQAHEILSNLQPKPRSQEKKAEILKFLSIVYLTMGRANAALGNYISAEAQLFQAQCYMEEFRKNRHTKEKKKILLFVKVLCTLAEFKEMRKQYKDACDIWREILELKDPIVMHDVIRAHKCLGLILGLMGSKQREEGVKHLNCAFLLANKSFGENSMKTLEIELKLAISLLNIDPPKMEDHLVHILSALSTCQGEEEDAIYFKAEEELISLLIESDRQEEANDLLKQSLVRKAKFFGEYSIPYLTCNKMLASFALSKGFIKMAVHYLKKCEEIEKILWGSNHPTADETKITLQLLMQNPQVCKESNPFRKTRKPIFISTVGSNPGF